MTWQTLAPEIVCAIFEHLVVGFPLPIFKPHLFPWNLGQVCSAWRDAFISCPKFWSVFLIDFLPSEISLDRFHLADYLVKLCLKRSRDHPICFRFVQTADHLEFPDEKSLLSRQMLQTLMAHSTHWEAAYFHMHMHDYSKMTVVKNRLPILRSLGLWTLVGKGPIEVEHFMELFEDVPQLQRIAIHHHTFRTIDPTTIPGTMGIAKSLAVKLFSQLTRIEELCIHSDLPPEFDGDVSALTFPFLKRLGVREIRYLQLLNTPALEELYIDALTVIMAIGDPYPELIEITARFMKQEMHLKKVSIDSSRVRWASFLLQNVPQTVQDLVFVLYSADDLELLPLCSASRYLSSVTIQTHLNVFLRGMVDIAKSWETQSSDGMGGIGPFENLQHLLLRPRGRDLSSYSAAVESFVKPFERRGVRCCVEPFDRDLHWKFHSDTDDQVLLC
ncbi:hypothetical protein JOM56_015281 [Amanita muscaria]